MVSASSYGVAVTSHTCWPASRCICASARVPGQILSAMMSSKISSPTATSSAVDRPSMNASALRLPSATSSLFSRPVS